MNKPKTVAIVGPTCSGKTSLSIEIATQFNGEVISADSRQVYTGLDVGTGKITKDEMVDIPHYLLDLVEPEEIYTGNHFVRDAQTVLKNILGRNKLPIIVGGTFFYVDLLRGKIQSAPVKPDQKFRESLVEYTNEELLDLLRIKDERRAEQIDGNNRRRLIRSLEIIETLGRVPEPKNPDSPFDWLIIGIDIEKEKLRDRFIDRLETWLERDLIEEVAEMRSRLSSKRFLELGFEYTLTADYIDEKISKEEFFEQFQQKNWQYAKRQMTWLKRDKEIEWFASENRDAIFRRVKQFLKND